MLPAAACAYLEVQSFLVAEARLLDETDWDAWLSLFTPDGVYWMPADPAQTDPLNHVSLMYDDATLRDLRCRRLRDRTESAAISLQPAPRCLRCLSNLEVFGSDAAALRVSARANVIFAQYSAPVVQTFHARVCWDLRAEAGKYFIRRKRVDLLNSDGLLSDILVFI
jgi:benzoate/toluate 1,2-dioxygenase beta subunit